MRLVVWVQLYASIRSLEFPASNYLPILSHDPAFPLSRVSSYCPGIEQQEKHSVQLVKDFIAGYVLVVLGPASDQWIERFNQLALLRCPISFHRLAQFFDVPLDRFLTWFYPGDHSQRLPVPTTIGSMATGRILLDFEA